MAWIVSTAASSNMGETTECPCGKPHHLCSSHSFTPGALDQALPPHRATMVGKRFARSGITSVLWNPVLAGRRESSEGLKHCHRTPRMPEKTDHGYSLRSDYPIVPTRLDHLTEVAGWHPS